MQEQIKLKAGKYLIKTLLTYDDGVIYVQFPFNRTLLDAVKQLDGATWHGFDKKNPRKIWSVKDNARNRFRLDFMQGKDVFSRYDSELVTYTPKRTLYQHQVEMVQQILTRKKTIIAGDMGTGKTLAFIEAAEYLKQQLDVDSNLIWYVGPSAGVKACRRELKKWDADIDPLLFTYEDFTSKLKMGTFDFTPFILCLDESQKIKTPTAQRSQAAMFVSEQMFKEYANDCYIIEMSGTPSPRQPIDWWHQAEVACPGYLKESNIHQLKKRLCLIEERESLAGGVYPHIITWLDDSNKCAICGQYLEHDNHDKMAMLNMEQTGAHTFQPSVNEVSELGKRLKGLVIVKLKSDCLDLPEKRYRVIKVKPDQETLRAAQLIRKKSPRAITAFTLLRELSDGFQYTEEVIGEQTCTECNGSGRLEETLPTVLDVTKAQDYSDTTIKEIECYCCGGSGKVPRYKRSSDNYSSPKDKVFIDLLTECSDVGRFVVWGGFTGTIDRLIDIAHQQGWATLRYDRLVQGQTADGKLIDSEILLDAMDNSHPRYNELMREYPRICFVGHPDAGGIALTLHASPIALYFSNSFKGESRIQSEDRIHRIGMDVNKGATIIDLIHLNTDLVVLQNLKQKKKLQNLTLDALDDRFVDGDIEIELYNEEK